MNRDASNVLFLSFRNETDLLGALRTVERAGVGRIADVMAPYPCPAIREYGGGGRWSRSLSCWGVCGGACGMMLVLGWLYATQILADPLVVQGRVQGWDMWPGYVPGIFEGMLLGAGLALVLGFALRGGLLARNMGTVGEVYLPDGASEDFLMVLEDCSEECAVKLLDEAGVFCVCRRLAGRNGTSEYDGRGDA